MQTLPVHTNLPVVYQAILVVLATREGTGAVNIPIIRVLAREAESLAPGALDRMIDIAEAAESDPKETSAKLQSFFRDAIRASNEAAKNVDAAGRS